MEITKEFLEKIYLDSGSIHANYFIDGMLFMAKELKHITSEQWEELVKINEELYAVNKYDQPGYDD